MLVRWIVRVALVVGVYLVGSFGSFLLLMLVTWDQLTIDLVGALAGAGLALVAFLKTKRLTQPPEPDPSTDPS